MALLLLLTNGWWFYQTLHSASVYKYFELERYESRQTVMQLETFVNSDFEEQRVEDFKQRVEKIFPENLAFVKEGYVNVGFLHFEVVGEYVVGLGKTRQLPPD